MQETLTQETLLGNKVMLLPFAEYDMGNFIRLHRADKNNNMGRFCLKDYSDEQALVYIAGLLNNAEVFIWSVFTKEDSPIFAGFVYLTNVSNYMCSLHGIMDKEFAKYLSNDKSLAEDSARTLINHCFEKGVNRIETDVCQSNRLALALDKKLGFVQEGVLRNHVIKNKGFENLVILSILRDEWNLRSKKQGDDS